jgi:UDP-N-acetylglucosamine 2-epimerase (non-hydrolysing)
LRENTERPITVSEGTNRVVGTDPNVILGATDEILQSGGKAGRIPALWDGHAAERIGRHISDFFGLAAEPQQPALEGAASAKSRD